MPITALIRVGFQTNAGANTAVRNTLTPIFQRVNTGVYHCDNAPDQVVMAAMNALNGIVSTHAGTLDFYSVSLTRVGPPLAAAVDSFPILEIFGEEESR